MIKLKSLLLEADFMPHSGWAKLDGLYKGLKPFGWEVLKYLGGKKYVNYFLHRKIDNIHTLLELKMLLVPFEKSRMNGNVIEYLCRTVKLNPKPDTETEPKPEFVTTSHKSLDGKLLIDTNDTDLKDVATMLNDRIEQYVRETPRGKRTRMRIN